MSKEDTTEFVYIVAANYPDDPHPHILAVYDNEPAVDEHLRAIEQSIKPSEPVAWQSTKAKIKSESERTPRRLNTEIDQ